MDPLAHFLYVDPVGEIEPDLPDQSELSKCRAFGVSCALHYNEHSYRILVFSGPNIRFCLTHLKRDRACEHI